MTQLSVAALARLVGVAPDTVRYYEKIDLLPPVGRTASSYRLYDDTSVDRMRFIQGAQRLGLRLADIKTLLEVRDTGICPCEPAEDLLRKRIGELDAELARLTALRVDLAAMVERLPDDCPEPAPGTWKPRQERQEEVRTCC
jgi:DNA-binding transcriptional MerR regulator